MKNILEELWYGNICPNTECREATKDAKELIQSTRSCKNYSIETLHFM